MNKMYSKTIPDVQNATAGQNSGFTLIELLVVVLIIGILAAVAMPEYTKAVEKSRVSDAMTQLRNLLMAEKAYKLSNLGYTSDLTLLDIQLPNIQEDATNKFSTNDWLVTVEIHPLYTTTMRVFAARAKNGVALADSNTYGILMDVASDGSVTFTCQQSSGNGTVPALCKSITGNAEGLFK